MGEKQKQERKGKVKTMDSAEQKRLIAFQFLDCPFCGERPDVTKHFKHDLWTLIHRCPVFGTISKDWSDLETLKRNWNTRA